jgi:hypothetical protein
MCYEVLKLSLIAYYENMNLISHTEGRTCIDIENRVLRRIFGPKREEVAGGWSRL